MGSAVNSCLSTFDTKAGHVPITTLTNTEFYSTFNNFWQLLVLLKVYAKTGEIKTTPLAKSMFIAYKGKVCVQINMIQKSDKFSDL